MLTNCLRHHPSVCLVVSLPTCDPLQYNALLVCGYYEQSSSLPCQTAVYTSAAAASSTAGSTTPILAANADAPLANTSRSSKHARPPQVQRQFVLARGKPTAVARVKRRGLVRALGLDAALDVHDCRLCTSANALRQRRPACVRLVTASDGTRQRIGFSHSQVRHRVVRVARPDRRVRLERLLHRADHARRRAVRRQDLHCSGEHEEEGDEEAHLEAKDWR